MKKVRLVLSIVASFAAGMFITSIHYRAAQGANSQFLRQLLDEGKDLDHWTYQPGGGWVMTTDIYTASWNGKRKEDIPLEQRAEAEIERLRSQANMCNAKLQTIELRASAAERQNAPPQALVELLNLIRPGLGNLLH
ncbi:MAG TPA: hypothetical protein VKV15_25965 [Bryobacteraceae bacterium]|jgi:hypothetical protein|nr:hypothetical protein [Bryobacteraceae bacterium]